MQPIAAGLAGAVEVTANDVDLFSMAACRLNGAANGVEITLSNDDLLEEPATVPVRMNHPDVVFLADVFYERELSDQVMALAAAAHNAGAVVLVGDPKRNYFPAGTLYRTRELPGAGDT